MLDLDSAQHRISYTPCEQWGPRIVLWKSLRFISHSCAASCVSTHVIGDWLGQQLWAP